MNKLILFPVLCFTILSFSSCDKTDEALPSNSDHITRSAWRFDKAMSGGTDVSGFVNACYKDNVITFLANGTGTLEEGASKCNSSDPQTVSFTWNFTDDGNTLNVTAGIFAGQSGAFKVISLNETQMILEGTVSTPTGNVTGQIYFKH